MTYQITAQNIKCGGCASTIIQNLNELETVDNCEVDIETGVVSVSGDEAHREQVTQLLEKLGYPEKA
jgi:copper chaperone CopZ